MARERKKDKDKKSKSKLTSLQIENLIFGYNFLCDDVFKTDKHRKNTWQRYKDYILLHYRDRRSDKDRTHLPLSYPSGSRPAAWWSFDNKHGMRRILPGNPEPVPMSDETFRGKWKLIKGDEPGRYESQFDFLKRNGLLFDGEEEAYLKNLEKEAAIKEEMTEKVKDDDNVIQFKKENGK